MPEIKDALERAVQADGPNFMNGSNADGILAALTPRKNWQEEDPRTIIHAAFRASFATTSIKGRDTIAKAVGYAIKVRDEEIPDEDHRETYGMATRALMNCYKKSNDIGTNKQIATRLNDILDLPLAFVPLTPADRLGVAATAIRVAYAADGGKAGPMVETATKQFRRESFEFLRDNPQEARKVLKAYTKLPDRKQQHESSLIAQTAGTILNRHLAASKRPIDILFVKVAPRAKAVENYFTRDFRNLAALASRTKKAAKALQGEWRRRNNSRPTSP